ncbi:MAG: dihydroorotate dehydrogenase electron transfer subunit [Lachnospiraceae bacterium]|nr:dihydroorotate dehydrogenase electron transfer subunit [Lachnospiraceae bacterium]
MSTYKETAKVISQETLADGICSMWIQTDRIAAEAKPGQFISVYCKDGSRMLPRPISICEIKENTLRIVYRVVGKGTAEFASYKAGDDIEITGPLGNGFPLDREGTAVVVGGGIGVPPMLELAKQLPGKTYAVMGYRNSQMFLKEQFEEAADALYIATEDGSFGTKGNVIDAMKEQGVKADVLYACGPMPMLRALKAYAAQNGMEAWISLEEKMACGIGACLACVCKSKEKDAHTNVHNKRICKEGPVFRAEEVEI